jgi:hypothetical protein
MFLHVLKTGYIKKKKHVGTLKDHFSSVNALFSSIYCEMKSSASDEASVFVFAFIILKVFFPQKTYTYKFNLMGIFTAG